METMFEKHNSFHILKEKTKLLITHNELREGKVLLLCQVRFRKAFIGNLLLECNKPDVVNKLSGDILIVSLQIQYCSLNNFKRDKLILRNVISFFTSEFK